MSHNIHKKYTYKKKGGGTCSYSTGDTDKPNEVCMEKIYTLLAHYIKKLNPYEQYQFNKANNTNMVKLLGHFLDEDMAAALRAASSSHQSGGGGRGRLKKKKQKGGFYVRKLQSCTGNPITDLVEFVFTQGIGIVIKVLQKEGVSLIGAIGQILDELNEVIPGHFDASKFMGLTNKHADLQNLQNLITLMKPSGQQGTGSSSGAASGSSGSPGMSGMSGMSGMAAAAAKEKVAEALGKKGPLDEDGKPIPGHDEKGDPKKGDPPKGSVPPVSKAAAGITDGAVDAAKAAREKAMKPGLMARASKGVKGAASSAKSGVAGAATSAFSFAKGLIGKHGGSSSRNHRRTRHQRRRTRHQRKHTRRSRRMK